MEITKTTINMATRRGLDLEIFHDDAQDVLLLNVALTKDNDAGNDAGVYYRVADGGLFFDSATINVEDWPHWIASDTKLRACLDEMALALTPKRDFLSEIIKAFEDLS